MIRVIQGVDKGLVHAVPEGSHVIGRGKQATIRLTPEEVSWEHAKVTREGEEYFIENLSALGTWVGDAKITGKVRLRPRDRIRLSEDCVVRLESATGGGLLESRAFLATALVLVVGLSVAAVFYSNGSGASGEDDWETAHRTLTAWLEQQSARHAVAPEAVTIFRHGWRLEQSNDFEHSMDDWVRLQIILSGAEPKLHCLELAAKDPKEKTLDMLLHPGPSRALSDDDLPAALTEFIRHRLKWATKQANRGLLKSL